VRRVNPSKWLILDCHLKQRPIPKIPINAVAMVIPSCIPHSWFVALMSGAFLLLSSATPAAETVTLTVDRDVVCIGEAITGSASLDYYGGNERPSVTISPALPENQMPDAGPSTKVFSFQTSESSTPGDHIITATASGAYPATKTVKVIKLEIEINNTASTDDDVVSWSDFIICRTRFQTPARIRQVPASGSSASDLEVTLSNSSRLEYAQQWRCDKKKPQKSPWIQQNRI